MTDIPDDRAAWVANHASAHIRHRHRKELLLKSAGLGAISIAFLMLFLLVSSLVSTGWQAFTQTHVTMDFPVTEARIKPGAVETSNFRAMMQDAMIAALPDMPEANARKMAAILSNSAQFTLRDRVVAEPALAGQTVRLTVPVSDPYDQLNKGLIDRDTPETNRRLSDTEIAAFDVLVARGSISKPFNLALFANADSRFPELAGLRGALVGSFYALMTCFLLSFPLGIGAAIYLEEFAPKNKLSDLIEININNLAAVPSMVFGMLAPGGVPQLVRPAAIGAFRGRAGAGADDAADASSLPRAQPEGGAASRSAMRPLGSGPRSCRRCFTTSCRWRCRAF